NWSNAKEVEIIRRYIEAVNLNGIAESGENKPGAGVGSDARKNGLTIAIMPEPRYGKWQLLKIPFLRFAGNPHQACGILERQSAQEQIVNQSEDGGVHPDRHRKSKDGKCGEPRRFAELSESKTNVVHKDKGCVLLNRC